VLGDSNNPNPPTGGLGYGKSQDFGLNLTAMAFTPFCPMQSGITNAAQPRVTRPVGVRSTRQRLKSKENPTTKTHLFLPVNLVYADNV